MNLMNNGWKAGRQFWVSVVLLAGLLLQTTAPVWANDDPVTDDPASDAAPVPVSPLTGGVSEELSGENAQRYTYAECNRADAELVEQEMVAIASGVLVDATSGLNFATLVDSQWQAQNMDAIFDAQVRRVVAEASAAPPDIGARLWLFTTAWVPARAEALAEQVVGDVLTSPEFSLALEELGEELAAHLAYEIEVMSARSATSMLLCLQAFVGTAYADNLYDSFARQALIAVEPDALEEVDATGELSPVEMHRGALAGGGILILSAVSRQIVQSLGKTLAGRMVGRVVTRILGRAGASLVPYAGWILGLGLIITDVVSGMQGALPQIESALLEEEVKIAIRGDIATVLADTLEQEIPLIANTLALALMGEWTTFCNTRPALCTVAAENSGYRNILASTPLADLDTLNVLTQSYVDHFGRAVLDQAIVNGEFYRLATLSHAAVTIFAATGAVDTTLMWVDVAERSGVPDALERIANRGLYRHLQPGDLAPAELATFITIEDNEVLIRLVDLDVTALATLLALIPGADLADVVADTSNAELLWLMDFLSGLDDSLARERYVAEIAAGVTTVTELQTQVAQPDPVSPDADSPEAAPPPAQATDGGTATTASQDTEQNTKSGSPSEVAAETLWFLSFNSVFVVSMFIFVVVVLAAAFVAVRQNSAEDVD
ncbi:MAG: hypothetical protein WDZ49_03175 [Litorilinea sp.]